MTKQSDKRFKNEAPHLSNAGRITYGKGPKLPQVARSSQIIQDFQNKADKSMMLLPMNSGSSFMKPLNALMLRESQQDLQQ